ncbi:MAG TPA: heavy metal sensor histidine kinase [Candidatus Dormibacteraeota bacterium]|nr:heavy metal sensor histidine kinase [Candidatus Dormibacteraeota bacterium]
MRKLSIGVRLTLWYVAIFAVAELVFGAGMWFILRHNLYDLVDDGLESQIDDLTRFLDAQKNDASIAKLKEEVNESYAIEHSGDFLELYGETGELLYRSSFLQAHPSILLPPDQIKRPIFRSREVAGSHFRFAFERLNVNGQVFIVEMGIPADDAVATLHLFRSYLWMFAPLLLMVAAGGGYWMSRRALSPVDALVRTARDVSGANLNSRLQKLTTGDELQRLSDTLNEMLDRIETAFLRVTQFTADASHELRTPVSLIRTEAELALRRSRGEAEYKESLRHILLEAERTTALIEQLLALARADSGREALHMQPVDLRPTLRSVIESWQQVATIRDLQFSTNIGDQTAFVMGDETLLRRLLDILLDNAFKYTPSPGSVRLLLEQRGDSVSITVKDSGVGIAPEDQDKIFERFYRVDKARSRAQGGSGLGLSIARWIVTQHRGSITVESRPGEGATFCAEFPKIAAPVESPQPA